MELFGSDRAWAAFLLETDAALGLGFEDLEAQAQTPPVRGRPSSRDSYVSMSKTKKAHPGRCHRKGLSLVEIISLFPNDEAAEDWFELQRWPEGIHWPNCGSIRYSIVRNRKPMPYYGTARGTKLRAPGSDEGDSARTCCTPACRGRHHRSWYQDHRPGVT